MLVTWGRRKCGQVPSTRSIHGEHQSIALHDYVYFTHRPHSDYRKFNDPVMLLLSSLRHYVQAPSRTLGESCSSKTVHMTQPSPRLESTLLHTLGERRGVLQECVIDLTNNLSSSSTLYHHKDRRGQLSSVQLIEPSSTNGMHDIHSTRHTSNARSHVVSGKPLLWMISSKNIT